MGDMNLAAYQAAVIGALDGLDSGHPRIADGSHTRCINAAASDLVREYPNHFPEHKDRSWEIGPTVATDNVLALPSNLLALRSVRSADSSTSQGDYSDTAERLVGESTAAIIGLLTKTSTTTGYPTLWARKATNLLYYPTTQTGHETYLVLYGDSIETPLSAGGDTFRLHRAYDEAVVLFAAAKMAIILDWVERAVTLESAVKRIMNGGARVVGIERGAKTHTLTSALTPR